jgi:hypothetical protein
MIDFMNITSLCRGGIVSGLLLVLAGCGGPGDSAIAKNKEEPKPKPSEVKKLSKNVFLERDGNTRRVLVEAYVCLRKGQLEQLLTRKRTKEHEAILAADVDARMIHGALLAAGALPGSTVKYKRMGDRDVVLPPTGTRIKITLRYTDKNNKQVTVPARRWIRQIKTGKDLDHDWVFAGSILFKDPLDETKPPIYGANDGDIICVSNFDTAMLDLPINSSKNNDDLAFEAHTERIPPLNTKVTMILEPVNEKKK